MAGPLAMLVVLAVWVVPADADVGSFEVGEYSRDFDVPSQQARETLETQASGAEADIVGQLEARLGSRYAGVWFDNERGEFVVPMLPNAGGAAVSSGFTAADLSGAEFRTSQAESSWAELQAAQERLDDALAGFADAALVQTSLDPRTNSVVAYRSVSLSEAEAKELRSFVSGEKVAVEVRLRDSNELQAEPVACYVSAGVTRICDKPLRGGVGLFPGTGGTYSGKHQCSAGFKALGIGTGYRYLLTAGHCAEAFSTWFSFDSGNPVPQSHYIGPVDQWLFNGGDWAKINVTGRPYWDEGNWPIQVAYWGVDQERQITGEGSSFVGQYVCRTGATTGASCGYVTNVDLSETTGEKGKEKTINNLTEVQNICVDEGDSGGSVFAGNTALGLVSLAKIANPQCEKRTMYYVEIIKATDALGVSVAPRTTQTSIKSTTPLNGNPGWVTVEGTVHGPGGTTVNGTVEIKLFKWENNSWVEKSNPKVSVNNNSYKLENWGGMGTGTWIAKAIFAPQSPFGGSESNVVTEGSFTIKDGYQLVNVYANKCLDVEGGGTANGVKLQQWTCANPASASHQVFTLVPKGDSSYQIVARNSNRCLDVVNAGTSNGVQVQQWDCGSQSNQIFKGVGIGQGTPWVQYIAKHSGKCLEIGGPSLNNGAKAQQWDCYGYSQGNQLWDFKSVDAGQIATTTTTEITQTLNGEYGWVSLGGNVSAGAYAINNVYVNANFYKKIGGSWTYMETDHPTVQNGHFAIENRPVGVGEWKVKVVFPSQGSLGESASGEPTFEIKKGYQLVNVYSGKCLDVEAAGTGNGVNLAQWTCGNPATTKNQVFTLEPRGNSYYHIVAKHSGRCVDVPNGSYNNGTWVQQWDCYGDEFFHQIWKGVGIGYGTPWVQFIAKHSEKCLEIGGPSLNNGARAQQWGCLGYSQGNQLWDFKSVSW